MFTKGMTKPPNSGRQKGVKNRKSSNLDNLLREEDCDVMVELAAAIKAKDIEMIKALRGLLDFVLPKLANVAPATENSPTEGQSAFLEATPEQLLKLVDE